MQNNPWDAFPATGAQPTPSNSGIIRPRVNPSKAAEERRDQIRTDIAIESNERDKEKFNVSQSDTNFNQARNLRKDFDQLPEVNNYKKIISSYAASINTDQTPEGDQLLINSYAQMLNPTSTVMLGEYQATEQNQSTLDQIRASIQRELKFDSAGRLLPESRARVREEMQNIAERANEAYNLRRNEYRGLAERYQFDPAEVIGPHLGDPFRPQIEQYRLGIYQDQRKEEQPASGPVPVAGYEDQIPPEFRGQVKEVLLDKGQVIGLTFLDESQPDLIFFDTKGGDDGSSLGSFVDGLGNVANSVTNPLYGAVQRAGMRPGYAERMISGLTLGSGDEFAGMGAAVARALQGGDMQEGYLSGRDSARFRNEVADQRTGFAGDAVEIGSSLLVPFGSARTVGRAALTGMGAGALGGFNYGEGAQNSLANAALGAAAGGTIGAGAGWLGTQIANRSAANTQRLVQENDLLRAAEATGVSPPARAFTDPALEARTRAVSQTMVGNQKIREGVQRFGDEIEGAVNNLSTGTPVRNNEAAGGMVREAAERQIKQTGASAKRSYDKAEKLAGDTRVTPTQSLQVLDQEIAALSETAGLNSKEISFLQSIRDDFSKDLSVGALRRARTKLRKEISKGDLVFGENEARVLSIMDAAAADIEAGLRSQGKQGAAAAFRAADIKYRARMDYINNTLQKVIGKRNAGLSNEAVMRKFRSLATPGGDSEGLRKFYASLTPEEAADVSATFAEMLGRGGKEGTRDFSTATLVENIEQLKKAGATMTTLFGKDGAKAINDIELLAREHKRIVGATSGGGSAAGNDWRFMLMSMVFPGAGSAAAGGDAVVTGLAAAAGLAIKAGRDALSAKLLMSPRFTNWMRTAPKSNNPTVIDKHWERLGAIAKAEPALAAEIDVFRNAIFSAANDNAQRAVAEDRQR